MGGGSLGQKSTRKVKESNTKDKNTHIPARCVWIQKDPELKARLSYTVIEVSLGSMRLCLKTKKSREIAT